MVTANQQTTETILHTAEQRIALGVRRIFKPLWHDEEIPLKPRSQRETDNKLIYDRVYEEEEEKKTDDIAVRDSIEKLLEARIEENERGQNELDEEARLPADERVNAEAFEKCTTADIEKFAIELDAARAAERRLPFPKRLTYIEGRYVFVFESVDEQEIYQVRVKLICDSEQLNAIHKILTDAQDSWLEFWENQVKLDNTQENGALSTPQQPPQGKETKRGKKKMPVTEDCKTKIKRTGRIVSDFEKSVYVSMFGAEKPTLKLMNDFLKAFHKEGVQGTQEEKSLLREEFRNQVKFVCQKQGWQLYCVPRWGGKAIVGRLDLTANGKSGNRFLVQPTGQVTADNPLLWQSVKPPKLSVKLA